MSSCNCGAGSTFGGGGGCGCGWSNCQRCSPCPSCSNAVPETCEPLGITGAPSMVVVSDTAYCNKTMQSPDTGAILTYNADTGLLEWNTGANLCLEDVPTRTNTEETKIFVQDDTCLKTWKPDYTAGLQQIIVADQGSETFSWQDPSVLYPPTGCGVLNKDCGGDTEGDITWQSGTEGQVLKVDSDGNWRAGDLTDTGSGTYFSQLVIQQSSNTQAGITAKRIMVFDSGNNSRRLSNVSVTADITVSGAGGLDTGSEASSTWYAIYVIYNSTTSTVNSLLSVSATSPTLPTDYTFFKMVGWIYNNSSSNFISFYQYGTNSWVAQSDVFIDKAGVASYTSQSLSAFIPPTAVAATGIYGATNTSGDWMAVAANTSGIGVAITNAPDSGSPADGYTSCSQFRVPIISSQTIYWKADATGNYYGLSITGWEINL